METIQEPAQTRQYYRESNSRTAGTMPRWGEAKTAPQTVTKENDTAKFNQLVSQYAEAPDDAAAISLTPPPTAEEDGFGFFDLLDIVNPLQHIPLVSVAYRAITGDEIKSMPRILGGAVFGGPAGAAMGIVNAVIEEETGEDIIGAATSLVRGDLESTKTKKSALPTDTNMDDIAKSMAMIEPGGAETSPEAKAIISKETKAYKDLPASLLGFAITPLPKTDDSAFFQDAIRTIQNEPSRAHKPTAQGRTAGTIAVYS